ncbi:hypothetical protein BIWAKO_05581 [Bosea sp. BIWAKO-01]|nr:hypothetical protein BIWAKO_05581 [Bosea sp. BIWAKO-01]
MCEFQRAAAKRTERPFEAASATAAAVRAGHVSPFRLAVRKAARLVAIGAFDRRQAASETPVAPAI